MHLLPVFGYANPRSASSDENGASPPGQDQPAATTERTEFPLFGEYRMFLPY